MKNNYKKVGAPQMMNKKKTQVDSVDTIIGADTTFEGKISSKTSLRVEGSIHGEVEIDGDITVGKDGSISHYVKARNITVAGKVEGELEATEKLHLLSSGHFQGKARMNALVIEDGARFEGESYMNQQSASEDTAKKEEKAKQKA